MGSFHQLHGGGVARVDFDGVGNSLTSDEVDPVESNQTELLRKDSGHTDGSLQQHPLAPKQAYLRIAENTSAVAKPFGSKTPLADKLAREPQQDGVVPIGGERDRAREAGDPLLEIHAPADRHAWKPRGNAVAPTRAAGLEQPGSKDCPKTWCALA
jgi:hypothetical protein